MLNFLLSYWTSNLKTSAESKENINYILIGSGIIKYFF